MRREHAIRLAAATALAAATCIAANALPAAETPLAVDSARVSIAGTSNIHPYTASTTHIRVVRAGLAAPGPDVWDNAFEPGVVDAFEVAIPAKTLTSPKEGLDKNMHKALKVDEFPDITFRLVRFDTANKPGGCARAIGVLRVAAVENEVAIDITTKRTGALLSVRGSFDLLMTDYGIKPPIAMLGMLKTDPKVTVTFETVLSIPLT